MDHPRPPAANPFLPPPQRHQLHLCRDCRHTGRPCLAGLALLERLRAAIAAAGAEEGFEISGSARLEGCDRPCTVVWRVSAGAAWLFGDADPAADIDGMVAQAGRGDLPREGAAAAVIATRAGVIQ